MSQYLRAGPVLVVEDSPTMRRQLQELLQDAGYETITANDGEIAIELIEQHHPEVVILDIVLPKKNGYQVCRRIKSDPDLAMKVVMATAKSEEKDRIWGKRQGADAYLSKPIRATDLLTVVSELASPVASPVSPSSESY